jgi:hypothetical protein
MGRVESDIVGDVWKRILMGLIPPSKGDQGGCKKTKDKRKRESMYSPFEGVWGDVK